MIKPKPYIVWLKVDYDCFMSKLFCHFLCFCKDINYKVLSSKECYFINLMSQLVCVLLPYGVGVLQGWIKVTLKTCVISSDQVFLMLILYLWIICCKSANCFKSAN